ncbi:GNAT family N-acetyltransferase [Chitinophaga sp. HK235]|uniref:GNAT family N-acetyltransferase n=1 Tax=Chitinophaga sp. HK235 TaxID=2952571 RepID=UPI001BA7FDC2|nr:GNAT family N-acetyltransferase [Chitinophaga sp. HK235]
MDITLKLLTTDDEIRSFFKVMKELRGHLKEEEFLDNIREQEQLADFKLLGAYTDGEPEGVAGFRISKCLAWGKFLYVDDLVTLPVERSKGHGKRMMDWLIDYARQQGCARFELDSGVQRFGAHRFYLRERMEISCHHFSLIL